MAIKIKVMRFDGKPPQTLSYDVVMAAGEVVHLFNRDGDILRGLASARVSSDPVWTQGSDYIARIPSEIERMNPLEPIHVRLKSLEVIESNIEYLERQRDEIKSIMSGVIPA